MSIAEADLKELVGKTVITPDGQGKVTLVGGRYIHVDIANGQKRQFDPRDVSIQKSEDKNK